MSSHAGKIQLMGGRRRILVELNRLKVEAGVSTSPRLSARAILNVVNHGKRARKVLMPVLEEDQ